jgi:hypothetical protein
MSLRRSEAIEAIPDVLEKTEIAALPSVAPKKQQYHWSKDVGAVPGTAQQDRSGIGPYELMAVSFMDNPGRNRGLSLAMTEADYDTVSEGRALRQAQGREHLS